MKDNLKRFLIINNMNNFVYNYSIDNLSIEDKNKLITFLLDTKQKISGIIFEEIVDICFSDIDYFNIIIDKDLSNLSYYFKLFLEEYFYKFNIFEKNNIIKFAEKFSEIYIYSDYFIQNLNNYTYSDIEKETLLYFFQKQDNYFSNFKNFDLNFRSNFDKNIGFSRNLLYIYNNSHLIEEILNFISEKIEYLDINIKLIILEKNLNNILFKNGNRIQIDPLDNISIFIDFIYDNYFEYIKKIKNIDRRIATYIEKEYFKMKLSNF